MKIKGKTEKRTEYARMVGQLLKVQHTYNGTTRRKVNKATEEIFKVIITKNITKLMLVRQQTAPRTSGNTKQDTCP